MTWPPRLLGLLTDPIRSIVSEGRIPVYDFVVDTSQPSNVREYLPQISFG